MQPNTDGIVLGNFFIQTSSSPHLSKEQNGIGREWGEGLDLEEIKAAVHTCAVLRPCLPIMSFLRTASVGGITKLIVV